MPFRDYTDQSDKDPVQHEKIVELARNHYPQRVAEVVATPGFRENLSALFEAAEELGRFRKQHPELEPDPELEETVAQIRFLKRWSES